MNTLLVLLMWMTGYPSPSPVSADPEPVETNGGGIPVQPASQSQ